jgi:hypothetical protein
MYIHVYIYVCTYIYTYIYKYLYIHISINTYIHSHKHIRIFTYICHYIDTSLPCFISVEGELGLRGLLKSAGSSQKPECLGSMVTASDGTVDFIDYRYI